MTTVSKGDKVLLSFSYCETCEQCKSGHPAYCYTFNQLNFPGTRQDGSSSILSADGSTPLFSSFFGQSSFARHTLVHRSSLVKVSPDTDLSLFAPLGCGVQTGAGAVMKTLDVKEGSSLAVFGAGSVGMAAIMAGKIRGAKTIIAVDLQPSRLELAKRMGATHGILGTADVVAEIRKICPPVGVNFAIDCTGNVKVIQNMIKALGTRGRAATVGATGFGVDIGVDVMDHLTYGKEYVGCCEGDSLPSEVSKSDSPTSCRKERGFCLHGYIFSLFETIELTGISALSSSLSSSRCMLRASSPSRNWSRFTT